MVESVKSVIEATRVLGAYQRRKDNYRRRMDYGYFECVKKYLTPEDMEGIEVDFREWRKREEGLRKSNRG